MPFIVGKGPNDIYQLKGGKDIKYRGVYLGTVHVWPEYILGSIDKSLFHEGNDNALRNYGEIIKNTYDNQPNRGEIPADQVQDIVSDEPYKGLQPEFDPAGGTFEIQINCTESSSWHYLAFRLLVPADVMLTGVYEVTPTGLQNFPDATISEPPNNIATYQGYYGDGYPAKIYTIDFDPNKQQYGELRNYDDPIKLTFSLEANNTAEYKIRDIVLYDVQNEWGDWQNITPIILTLYKQVPNFLYQTQATWVLDSNLRTPSRTSQLDGSLGSTRIIVDWETLSATAYIAVSFGISQDGAQNWHFGPVNDHLDEDGKLNQYKGHILDQSELRDSSIITISSADANLVAMDIFKAEIQAPLQDYDHYIIPIAITAKNTNDEENNSKKTIYYQWASGTTNTNWSPNPLSGGNPDTSSQSTSRTIKGIERLVGADDRVIDISIEFNYERHSFELRGGDNDSKLYVLTVTKDEGISSVEYRNITLGIDWQTVNFESDNSTAIKLNKGVDIEIKATTYDGYSFVSAPSYAFTMDSNKEAHFRTQKDVVTLTIIKEVGVKDVYIGDLPNVTLTIKRTEGIADIFVSDAVNTLTISNKDGYVKQIEYNITL